MAEENGLQVSDFKPFQQLPTVLDNRHIALARVGLCIISSTAVQEHFRIVIVFTRMLFT